MIEEQALDRVHRIGQQNDVQIFRYLVKDSIESVCNQAPSLISVDRELIVT